MKVNLSKEEFYTIKGLKEKVEELINGREVKNCAISHFSTRGKLPHLMGSVVESENLTKFYKLLDIKEEMEKHITKVLYNNIDDANNIVVSLRNDYIHTQWVISIDFK